MQDAVAEVLRSRAPRGSDSIAWFASGALHLVLITAVVLAAGEAREETKPKSVSIRLAGGASLPNAPRTRGGETRTQPPVAQPSPTPLPPKAETKNDPLPPKTITPTPTEAPTKPTKKSSEGESLFGRSEFDPKSGKPAPPPSKAAAAGGAPAAAAPLPGATVGGMPGIGKAGVTSLEGGPFPYDAYIERMVSLIGTHWFRPQSGQESIAQVYFVIDRNGSVRDVKIETSSGDTTFDRAARRAVIEASPLPPLPLAYGGTFLGVHLTFH